MNAFSLPLDALHLEDRGLLGQGGMGQVRRVYDPRFGREAALKILLQSQDPQQVMRFVREVRISARLDHPGIPPVYDSGRLPQGQHYMLMKLVQGETLKQRLDDYHQQGRPPRLFRDFIETLLRVCEAVSYAHDQGLVHRDLKPENIMIGSFFEVLVMDWGLARDVRESEAQDQQFKVSVTGLTQDGEVLGTPAYMSPEQARGESLDQQTDVFALGVILGNILTDQPLVSLNSVINTVYAMGEGRYQSPLEVDPSVAKDWSELVERAMALDPEQRTASVADFADQVKTLLDSRTEPGPSSARVAWAITAVATILVLALWLIAEPQSRRAMKEARDEGAKQQQHWQQKLRLVGSQSQDSLAALEREKNADLDQEQRQFKQSLLDKQASLEQLRAQIRVWKSLGQTPSEYEECLNRLSVLRRGSGPRADFKATCQRALRLRESDKAAHIEVIRACLQFDDKQLADEFYGAMKSRHGDDLEVLYDYYLHSFLRSEPDSSYLKAIRDRSSPGSQSTRHRLVTTLLKLDGQPAATLKSLKQLRAEIKPDDPMKQDIELWTLFAQASVSPDLVTIPNVEAALSLDPSSALAVAIAGYCYLQLEATERALTIFYYGVFQYPQLLRFWLGLADCLLLKQDYKNVKHCLQVSQKRAHGKLDQQLITLQFQQAVAKRDQLEPIEQRLKAIAKDPSLRRDQQLKVLKVLRQCQTRSRKNSQALDTMKTLYALQNNVFTTIQLAECHYEVGSYKDAQRFVQQALTMRPKSAYLHCLDGIIHYELGQHREAIQAAKRGLAAPEKSPRHDEDCRILIARCYTDLGDEKALLALAEDTRKAGLVVEYLFTQIILYYISKNDFEKVKAWTRKQLTNAPHYTGILVMNAKSHFKTGDLESAMALIDIVQRIAPENSRSRKSALELREEIKKSTLKEARKP